MISFLDIFTRHLNICILDVWKYNDGFIGTRYCLNRGENLSFFIGPLNLITFIRGNYSHKADSI